jgi:hypothetical protein
MIKRKCLFSNYLLDINPTTHTIAPIINDMCIGILNKHKVNGKNTSPNPKILAPSLFFIMYASHYIIIPNIILLQNKIRFWIIISTSIVGYYILTAIGRENVKGMHSHPLNSYLPVAHYALKDNLVMVRALVSSVRTPSTKTAS